MDDVKSKYQYEGLKWLFELELLDSPQAINTLKFNILSTSPRIKEADLLIFRENKSMLILLNLTWMGRKFYKKQIMQDVYDIMQQFLPSFKFRVTDDPKIMELAIERIKKALTGGSRENDSNVGKPSIGNPNSKAESVKGPETDGTPTSNDPSKQEQS